MGLVDDEGPGQLLRRPGPRRRARRRAHRRVRARGVPRLDRRARRAVDVPQVPVPAEGRLEGLRRRARTQASTARLRSPGSTPPTGMATPLAQAEYERFYATLAPGPVNGHKPLVHQRLATHWARLIELLYAAERWVELATDPEITSDDVRAVPTRGADRGRRDGRGAAGHADPPLLDGRARDAHAREPGRRHDQQLRADQPCPSPRRPGASSTTAWSTDGLLNRIEMAFRAYDPCFGCATHSLPGQMPLEVAIRNAKGEIMDVRRQHC